MLSQQQTIPPFKIYSIDTDSLKTCYEAQNSKLICTLSGPYHNKNVVMTSSTNMGHQLATNTLMPVFNISVDIPHQIQQELSFNSAQIQEDNTQKYRFSKKKQIMISLKTILKQILMGVIIQERYLRMCFDITFQMVQFDTQYWKLSNEALLGILVSQMANLLCFTLGIGSVQIRTLFSCITVCMDVNTEKITYPQYINKQQQTTMIDQNQQSKTNTENMIILTVAMENLDKQNQVLYFNYCGPYSFLNYQKMLNFAMNSTEAMMEYIQGKVSQEDNSS